MENTLQVNPNNCPVGLIGAGNMAWQLGHTLAATGFPIACVYSRTAENAKLLSSKLNCPSTHELYKLTDYQPKLWLLCIADSAFEEVLPQLKLSAESILAHTSGSQSMLALKAGHDRVGVFYPLQTMSKDKAVNFGQVPFFIEAVDKETERTLWKVAEYLSGNIHLASSDARKRLHLAAVFACNFTNHLWAVTDQLLKDDGLSVNVLGHLIQETADKALRIPPAQAQTGPAVRGDYNIMEAHLQMLHQYPDFQQIYELLSKSIIDTHN